MGTIAAVSCLNLPWPSIWHQL